MKKIFSVGVLILFSLINDSFGAPSCFYQLGECYFQSNPSGCVCVPGTLGFCNPDTGTCCCQPDCAVFEDEASFRDTDWKIWGGLPFMWEDYGSVLSSICVRQSCLDEVMCPITDSVVVCAQGFYGSPAVNGLPNCTQCPSDGMSNIWSIGGFAITDCYIPANSERSDSTGTYKVTSDCYYSL